MPKSLRKGFAHLTQTRRDRIKALLDAGETQIEIGKIVKTNQSTVSREEKHRNQDGIPKGTDWNKVSEEKLQSAILFLNMKYRKSLKYQNALEVARAHKFLKNAEGRLNMQFTREFA